MTLHPVQFSKLKSEIFIFKILNYLAKNYFHLPKSNAVPFLTIYISTICYTYTIINMVMDSYNDVSITIWLVCILNGFLFNLLFYCRGSKFSRQISKSDLSTHFVECPSAKFNFIEITYEIIQKNFFFNFLMKIVLRLCVSFSSTFEWRHKHPYNPWLISV